MVTLIVSLSRNPTGKWVTWNCRFIDAETKEEYLPLESGLGWEAPYTFENMPNKGSFYYSSPEWPGTEATTHVRSFTESGQYVINSVTGFVQGYGKPWEGWRPSLEPLGIAPWQPGEGPPLPRSFFPPWPWIWLR